MNPVQSHINTKETKSFMVVELCNVKVLLDFAKSSVK